MAFIPCDDVFQVQARGTIAGRSPWVMNWHLSNAGEFTLDQVTTDNIASQFHDAFEDSGLLGFLSTGWTLDEYVVTDLDSATSPQFINTSQNSVGTDGGQILPGQTAGMIEWVTGLRGRSFRGRSFFAGFTESASDGLPTAGCVAALNLWASGVIGDLTTFGTPLGVLSRFSGTKLVGRSDGQTLKVPKPRDNGIITAVTSGVAETVWKTQRRRAFPG